jgi:hypothetical protein
MMPEITSTLQSNLKIPIQTLSAKNQKDKSQKDKNQKDGNQKDETQKQKTPKDESNRGSSSRKRKLGSKEDSNGKKISKR